MRSAILVLVFACGGSHAPVDKPQLPPDQPVKPPEPAKQVTETWSGTLLLGFEMRDIVVTFTGTGAADKWTATLAVPDAKVTGLPLTDVALDAGSIKFTLAKPDAPQANEHYELARTGESAIGALAIGPQRFYVKLVHLKAGEAPRPGIARPQTPKPPYPYTEREVTIDAPEAGKLAGTLTIPSGTGPFPAVVLITGSGQQDRDETILRHRPFRILADRLTRDGFVVLRTDDRGVGSTEGTPGSLETDFGDARAAFEWLGKQKEVDPKRVGLLGHSIGGLIAPTVAARTGKVAFIVSLAGPGVPGGELIATQIEAMLVASHVPQPAAAKVADQQRKVAAAVIKGDPKAIKLALRTSHVESAKALGQPVPDDAALDKLVEQSLPSATNPWVTGLFKTDPAAAWRKVKCPVLAVNGEKDLQVAPDTNLSAIAKAAAAGGNKDVTTKKQPGLNHLYQHADTGLIDEYGVIEESFDPATLDLIATWMVDKTKKK